MDRRLRPFAYDREYLIERINAGYEVVVEGKSFTKVEQVPSQAVLDDKLRASGLDASMLDEPGEVPVYGLADTGDGVRATITATGERGAGGGDPNKPPETGASASSGAPAPEPVFAGYPLSYFEGKSDAQIKKVKGVNEDILKQIRDAQAVAKQ